MYHCSVFFSKIFFINVYKISNVSDIFISKPPWKNDYLPVKLTNTGNSHTGGKHAPWPHFCLHYLQKKYKTFSNKAADYTTHWSLHKLVLNMFSIGKFAVILAVVVVTNAAKKFCDRPCPLVKCVVVKADDCKEDEVFVARDGLCYCCDTCVKKAGGCKGAFMLFLLKSWLFINFQSSCGWFKSVKINFTNQFTVQVQTCYVFILASPVNKGTPSLNFTVYRWCKVIWISKQEISLQFIDFYCTCLWIVI